MNDRRPPTDGAFEQLIAEALGLHRSGRFAEAERLYRNAIATDPDKFEPNHLLGILLHQQQRSADGLPFLERAVALDPASAKAQNNLGAARLALGDLEGAAESFERAVSLDQTMADAHYNLANALVRLNKAEPAIPHFERFLAAEANVADAHNNLGAAYLSLGRGEEAEKSFERALALDPSMVHAQANLGRAMLKLRRPAAAIAILEKVVAREPGRYESHVDLGLAHAELGDFMAAAVSHRRAVGLNPKLVVGQIGLATAYRKLDRLAEAIEGLRAARELNPESEQIASNLAMLMGQACDWRDADDLRAHVLAACEAEMGTVEPFVALTLTDDPTLQLKAARSFVKQSYPAVPAQPRLPRQGGRIRLGYLSADFNQHPVASLIVRLIELHDRERFEVHGFSAGRNDHSGLRQRLKAAFDAFTDVRSLGDDALARLLREQQIDILIELGGHTENARIAALKSHPVPVQVSFLGYPGTTGAPFIDYTFVDKHVAPMSSGDAFSEKLVLLPDTFQPNDDKLTGARSTPSRRTYGLPETGFVFCSFNNSYKITPAVFDVWMRLLQDVPSSVLWLARSNAWVMGNLRREAQIRGIQPDRLLFATRVADHGEHLARQRLADLFLDTWPYNAHTTASEALRGGLPILTCMGRSLAARVAGSLLSTIGLPELVTHSVADYEAKARELAQHPELLRSLRARLEIARKRTPLFDANRFRRHIEAAYTRMWGRCLAGLPPETFEVHPLDVDQLPTARQGESK